MKTTRPLRLLAASLLLGSLAACRSPKQEAVAPLTAPTGAPLVAETPAPSKIIVDRTLILSTAQTTDGTVWGIGYDDGRPALFRWEGDVWTKLEAIRDRPGELVGFAADPTRQGATVSLWKASPQDRGKQPMLHLWRHEPGRPSASLATIAHPTWQPNTLTHSPGVAVDSAGDVWLTFPAALVVRIPAGGAPELIEIPQEHFTRRKSAHFRHIVFTPEAPGLGWLWSGHDGFVRKYDNELTRPLRVADGKLHPSPLLAGLPTARVTLVAKSHGGRIVWALENAGLWEIDPAAGAATPRSSPPGAWRIVDWCELEDGVEVALAASQTRGPDRLVGNVWIRLDGQWIDAGPSGATNAASHSCDWLVSDQIVLGAGSLGRLIAVDLAQGKSAPLRARSLGWQEHLPVRRVRASHPLSDGRVLVHGSGTVVAEPGALRRGWEAADQGGPPPAEFDFTEVPIRAADGRLWCLEVRGRGAPVLKHWDGERWHHWSLPAERPWWHEEALWVDARGRVAVFSPTLENPAWERDETAPDGWRRWPNGRALVTARATEAEPTPTLERLQRTHWHHPVLSPNGQVLVVGDDGFWHFANGQWTNFAFRTLGASPARYGFEEDGTPWCEVRGVKRLLQPDRTWQESERPTGAPPSSHGQARTWPAWLSARRDNGRIDSVQQDSEGVWWWLQGGELWKGHEGDVVQVFADAEPSPFRAGIGARISAVHVDKRGHRLFTGAESWIFLSAVPGPELTIVRNETVGTVDQVVQVAAEGVVRFDWRLNDGTWQRASGGTLWLRELPVGVHTLEIRAYNRRLEAGPITRVELRLDYDAAARIEALVKALASPEDRLEAVHRLVLRGAEAQPALQAALAKLAVPWPELKVVWDKAAEPADRVAHVTAEGLEHFEWRLDNGPWQRASGETLRLRELTAGVHALELRGYNRRLEAGPITRVALRLDYDEAARMEALVRAVMSPKDEARREAVQRLVLRGAEAERALQAALVGEADDNRRWWLRAALQAVADAATRRE